jgi:carboxymethylenebutenolidase
MTYDIRTETVFLKGHGGDEVEAYLAEPMGQMSCGGVVVIHHMPGYDRSTKEIARRFAADEGLLAVMPNLYYREAPGASSDDAAAAARARGGVPDERLIGDVKGAIDHIRSLPASNGKVGCIGYCSGGRQSFLSATEPGIGLDAAVACYPGAVVYGAPPEAPVKMPALLHRAKDLTCPLLGLFGDEDKFPSPEEVAVLANELGSLGKDFEFHSYPGAGHAFFDVDRPSYRVEAATQGWAEIHEFFGTHLSS